jgi:hypothetical protein
MQLKKGRESASRSTGRRRGTISTLRSMRFAQEIKTMTDDELPEPRTIRLVIYHKEGDLLPSVKPTDDATPEEVELVGDLAAALAWGRHMAALARPFLPGLVAWARFKRRWLR